MRSCDDVQIARWPSDAEVAFVIGIDEIGNIGNDDGVDFTDWGRHFARPDSFFQSEFLPLIESYPSVKFTIGAWLGEYGGVTDKTELRDGTGSIEPYTDEWESWLASTIRPTAEHEQIELVPHGLRHEDWVALTPAERRRRLEEVCGQFREHLGLRCEGVNTWPYGTIPREDLPGLLAERDVYVTGVLTTPDLPPIQRIKAHLKRVLRGKRYIVAPTTTNEPGAGVELGPDHTGRIGEFGYWTGEGGEILSLPYSQNVNDGFESVRSEIEALSESEQLSAPAYYLFAHLRETSPEQQSPDPGGGIEGRLDEFGRLLSWVTERDWVWCGTLTEAAAYHDVRERATVSLDETAGERRVSIDTSRCFDWSRVVDLTLSLDGDDGRVHATVSVCPEDDHTTTTLSPAECESD